MDCVNVCRAPYRYIDQADECMLLSLDGIEFFAWKYSELFSVAFIHILAQFHSYHDLFFICFVYNYLQNDFRVSLVVVCMLCPIRANFTILEYTTRTICMCLEYILYV